MVGTLNALFHQEAGAGGLFTDAAAAVVFAACQGSLHFYTNYKAFLFFSPFFFFVALAFTFSRRRRRLVLKERGSQERTIHTFPAVFFSHNYSSLPPFPLYTKTARKSMVRVLTSIDGLSFKFQSIV